jgi:threonine aldolase
MHPPQSPAEVFGELARYAAEHDLESDRYGAGGVVEALEARVCELLGTEAAAFLPSGTMAQPIALRLHADARGVRTVAHHPTAHIELHEDDAYRVVYGLHGRLVGDAREPLTRSSLDDVVEPIAALLVELPQRELGGLLPSWDDLVAQTTWARDRGAAVHLDGARLWECGPGYDRPYSDIAGLFDTVYVSFYKGLGGIAGACLAGPADLVAQARVWRHRVGGTLWALYPYAVAALQGLEERLPRMPAYAAHARAIAAALHGLDGVEVVPTTPTTTMFHLLVRADVDALKTAVARLATEKGVWTWPGGAPTDSPSWRRLEFTVGDGALDFTPAEVRAVVQRLLHEATAPAASAAAHAPTD